MEGGDLVGLSLSLAAHDGRALTAAAITRSVQEVEDKRT